MVDGRIMEIRLKTGNKHKKLSITNSYAPHMGYGEKHRTDYWGNMNKRIQNIPQNHIKMRCTDNNGQIAQDNIQRDKTIGKWAISKKN